MSWYLLTHHLVHSWHIFSSLFHSLRVVQLLDELQHIISSLSLTVGTNLKLSFRWPGWNSLLTRRVRSSFCYAVPLQHDSTHWQLETDQIIMLNPLQVQYKFFFLFDKFEVIFEISSISFLIAKSLSLIISFPLSESSASISIVSSSSSQISANIISNVSSSPTRSPASVLSVFPSTRLYPFFEPFLAERSDKYTTGNTVVLVVTEKPDTLQISISFFLLLSYMNNIFY